MTEKATGEVKARTVRAERFELVDGQGKVRAVLYADARKCTRC